MSDQLKQAARIVEAAIFASAEPVAERALEERLPEGVGIDEVIALVAGRYGEDSGIELRRAGKAWAFRTRPDVAPLLAVEKVAERPLSRAALETLAVIAYHQPVTRAEIERIRGVSSVSSGSIDMLLEQGWISPRGRRRTPGRPLTWGTTEAFLDHFGLDDVMALPGLEELKQAGLLRTGVAISDENGLGEMLASDFGEEGAGDGPPEPEGGGPEGDEA